MNLTPTDRWDRHDAAGQIKHTRQAGPPGDPATYYQLSPGRRKIRLHIISFWKAGGKAS